MADDTGASTETPPHTSKRPREDDTSEDLLASAPTKRPETSADGNAMHGEESERGTTASSSSSAPPLAEEQAGETRDEPDPKPKLSFASAGGFAAASSGGGFAAASSGGGFGALLSGKSSTGLTGNNTSSSFSSLLGQSAASVSAQPTGKRKPFGADEEEEEDDGEGDVEEEPDTAADDQYVAVRGLTKTAVVTGEEEEECLYTCKCKLYAIDATQPTAGWKERGVGTLRLLSRSPDAYRLVMRADAVLRVILNVPLTRTTSKVEPGGESMGDKTIRLQAVESGLPTWFAIRLGNRSGANELKSAVEGVLVKNEPDPDIVEHDPPTADRQLDAVEETETRQAATIDAEKDGASKTEEAETGQE